MGMRRLWVAVLACVVVPLVGCSDGEPKAAPAPKVSATESVAPQETAEEFIRRWNDSLNEAQAGRAGEWDELTKDCLRCADTTELFAGIYRDGGYVKTKGRTVAGVKASKADDRPHVYVVELVSAPSRFRRTADGPEERLEGGAGEIHVRLDETPAGWRVVDMWQNAA